MRVGICFFGLTRSLRWTRASIERCLLQPLRDADIPYEIFLHTYGDVRVLSNRRSRERNCRLDPEEWRQLRPDRAQIDSQAAFDAEFAPQARELRRHGDAWHNSFASFVNLLRQLNSLACVTTLWQPRAAELDVLVYARPDLEYHDPLDAALLRRLAEQRAESVLVTPCWQRWFGLNDRFALATPPAALAYGQRLALAQEYCRAQGAPLHAERLLAFSAERAACRLEFTSLRATRIRANGRRQHESFGC